MIIYKRYRVHHNLLKVFRIFIAMCIVAIQASAQDKNLVQIKTFDESLVAFPAVEVSINGNEFFQTDKKGVAFVEIAKQDLPPQSIAIKGKDMEAASWNYSRGVLEIIVRKRNYNLVKIFVVNERNEPLDNLEVTFIGRKTLQFITRNGGSIEVPLALDEKINNKTQFRVREYVISKLLNSGENWTLIVAPLKVVAEKENKGKVDDKYFKNFDLKNLDSIKSLTVFYAVFKNYQISDLSPSVKARIDAKFNELISGFRDSVTTQIPAFIGRISDSSFVKDDFQNLLSQATLEGESLDLLNLEFNDKIKVISDKLVGGTENLDLETRTQLLRDINLLEAVLKRNAQKFYKNNNEYLSVLTTLKSNFFDIEDLENKLQLSEAQRLEAEKDFEKKLYLTLAVTTIFAILIIVLILLSGKLKRQQEQLVKVNEEIKHINENLEEIVFHRTKSLELANKELDLFLYRSSHDLRGPICSIIGLCNIARFSTSEEIKVLMEKIYQTAFGMDKMSKKLRVLGEISDPKDYKLIHLRSTLNGMKNSFENQIADNAVDFAIECSDELTFSSYPFLIETILFNLIENALLYTNVNGNGSEIKIEAYEKGGSIYFSVYDNGIGVDPGIKDRLWDMFFIGHEQSRGNGLGLYVVKKSVEALHGNVFLESELNVYTVFTISIPVSQQDKSPSSQRLALKEPVKGILAAKV